MITKYPWQLVGIGDDYLIESKNGLKSVAEVHNHGDKGDPEALSNACLIAAAPELLEACKATVYILKTDAEWAAKEIRSQPWYDRAEKAIAKAENS